jgi:hypothetical protein
MWSLGDRVACQRSRQSEPKILTAGPTSVMTILQQLWPSQVELSYTVQHGPQEDVRVRT